MKKRIQQNAIRFAVLIYTEFLLDMDICIFQILDFEMPDDTKFLQ